MLRFLAHMAQFKVIYVECRYFAALICLYIQHLLTPAATATVIT